MRYALLMGVIGMVLVFSGVASAAGAYRKAWSGVRQEAQDLLQGVTPGEGRGLAACTRSATSCRPVRYALYDAARQL